MGCKVNDWGFEMQFDKIIAIHLTILTNNKKTKKAVCFSAQITCDEYSP